MTAPYFAAANAHDCFLNANKLFACGHYLDAQTLFDRACRLDPNNAAYAEARKKLRILALSFWKKGGGNPENAGKALDCSGECGECCCEACGEGCCEGCGEICCESCCENCDCDCS